MSESEIFVAMGALAVTADPGTALTTIGLGSCVGIALIDSRGGAAGLAHAMFPQAPGPDVDEPGRYADTAVRAMLSALADLGCRASQLSAVLTGGARMFAFERSSSIDIGARNIAATRDALATAGVPVCACATGGSIGRSVRVRAADGIVRLREAGTDRELYRWAPSAAEGRGSR